MGNCCCLVGGKKRRYAAKKNSKSAPTFLDHDYDDDYDIDECLTSATKHKNIRRGGGCNRANNAGGGGGGSGGGIRRPKNSKNNKNFLATYLATDLANNTKATSANHVNVLLNNNSTIVCRATTNENGNANGANIFVENMLATNNNNNGNENDIESDISQPPAFPHPQKSTITYYQNKMNQHGMIGGSCVGIPATTLANNSNSGMNSLSGGKLFCGMTSNSSSSMLSSTPSRRGCDNSQIMNNLSKAQLNQFTNLANKLSNLANETSTQQYIIGNALPQICTDETLTTSNLATTRMLNNRRDSIDSHLSSSSVKIVQNNGVKVLQRRKINLEHDQNYSLQQKQLEQSDQQKTLGDENNFDTNSIEVEIIEMDHSLKTSSISSCSSGIGICENFSNSKRVKKNNSSSSNNYRSLQKSKKSIKNIEATLRNSCSIEKWLNDFGKLQPDDQLKSKQLARKFNSKVCSNENLCTNSSSNTKAVKRAKSFCDYENGNQIENANNTQKLLIKKKKLKKTNNSKISLDENEEINSMNNQKFSNHEEEEVKCKLEIENHKPVDLIDEDQVEYDDFDEQADELKRLLLEIHKEHDMEKQSTSSDANFKHILQQLIESSSKLNQTSNILQGLTNQSKSNQQNSQTNLNVIKLIDSIGHLMKTNHFNRIQTLEKEMRQHISRFLLPRSLANSEDIDYLKWLLNEKNFHLTLCQPIIYSALYTHDRLTLCEQTDYTYLLNVTNLNVKLVEKQVSSSPDDHDSLNTTSDASSSSEDDEEIDEDFELSNQESVKDNAFYVKFVNEKLTNSGGFDQELITDEFCGSLLISYKKIKKILAKEKCLIEKCRMNKIRSETETTKNFKEKNTFLIAEDMLAGGDDFIQKQKRILEIYRQRVMNTSNFRGARCLLNIKSKQILNRKTNGTSNLLKLASAVPVSKAQNNNSTATTINGITVSINTNGIGSNCSSLSSSISPSASSTSSSTNSMKRPSRLKPRKIQKYSSYTNGMATQTSDENNSSSSSHQCYLITYSDLNERLFSCLLSNFSCKLVDNFLKTSTILKNKDLNESFKTMVSNGGESGVASDQFLQKTGFIRKQKLDKSFSFINIVNDKATNLLEHNLQQNTNSIENSIDLNTPSIQVNHNNHMLNLNVDTNTIKLCLKLNKWPQQYKRDYFQRKRINTKWPSKKLLNYIESNTCLITYSIPNSLFTTEPALIEDTMLRTNDLYAKSTVWQLDTRLAESVLFKSLNQIQSFIFYFFYLTFNNLVIETSNTIQNLIKKSQLNSCSQAQKSDIKNLVQTLRTTKIYLFNFLSERMFRHHFFRFFELNKFNLETNNEKEQIFTNKSSLANSTINFLFDLTLKFSVYMRFVLEKYKTLNKPNYFSLNRTIASSNEYQLFLNKNFSNSSQTESEFVSLVNEDLINSFVKFENVLNETLIKKLKKNDLKNNLKSFDQFLDVIRVRFGNLNNLTSIQISSPLLIDNSIVTAQKFKTLETLMNLSENSSSASSKYYSPLNTHYSANTYVFIYINEFFNSLFEQFKSKRDNFQINEQLLLKLHTQILKKETIDKKSCEILEDKFINAIKMIDQDRLLSQFEEYAECVHKYLPQIRQHNQYLLFHYVWTMQVQYLAPFFNYLCDFYPPLH